MGLIMPRRAGLTADVSSRFESFVVLVLLPLFFVVTGLRTEVNALNRPVLWALTLLLIAVAIAGKFLGAMFAARYGGFSLRDSAAIGALMNTRGLTELIVLNIGLDLGVISTQLFTMLVVMALVTTFMAGPILRLIDPRYELSEPVEEELRQALRQTDEIPMPALPHAILVAPQDEKNLDALLALAEPLAKTTPPRELVIAQIVIPNRFVTGTSLDANDVEIVSERLGREARRAGRARRRRPGVRIPQHPSGRGLRPPRLGGRGRPRHARRPAATARRRGPARPGRRGPGAGAMRRRGARRTVRHARDRRAAPSDGSLRWRRPRLGRARARRLDRDRAQHAAEAARRTGLEREATPARC